MSSHADQIPPLIAILRGITPPEIEAVGAALFDAGFRAVEVPLNSPEPLVSIRLLSECFGEAMLIGAGTVLNDEAVVAAYAAGARVIVSPNTDPAVIVRTKALGLISVPGVLTPTEAFAALAAGADGLKLYPADVMRPGGLGAMLAVLPPATRVFAVGGVDPTSLAAWRNAGAAGIGVGSQLYRPGDPADLVATRAADFVRAWGTSAA